MLRLNPSLLTPRPLAAALALVFTLAACGGQAKPAPSPSPKFNPVYGVDYGPWTQGDQPGPQVPDDRIRQQLQVLKGRSTWIKIGGSTGGVENAPKIAHELGFKVASTAYINGKPADEAAEIAKLEENVKAGYVDLAIVGNEAVHNSLVKPAALAEMLKRVRQDTGGKVPVATVEPAKELIANPVLVQSSDVVIANITPFSFHIPEAQALAWIQDNYKQVQAAAGGKEVRLGETEWPSEGGAFGSGVVASQENQVAFMSSVVSWSRQNKVGVFLFEAFDEPWLKQVDSSFGPHWGLWSDDLTLKPGLEVLFKR